MSPPQVTDRLFFEELINFYQFLFSETSEVIEVLEVYGKTNLEKYRKFLETISVPNFIVADFDYLQNVGNEDIKNLSVNWFTTTQLLSRIAGGKGDMLSSKRVKEQIVDIALNGSGIRDTARVFHVSTSTVIKELKKRNLNYNK
ncbi:hypothetical protein H6G17_27575 [Chroococcidiopsis sp. FACHB-1243]|nr:hypothetical protein [Chroococcidiopsis sp. [FACHB-1243]]